MVLIGGGSAVSCPTLGVVAVFVVTTPAAALEDDEVVVRALIEEELDDEREDEIAPGMTAAEVASALVKTDAVPATVRLKN